MGERNKPRSGSMAYYPRKRAAKETPTFKSYPKVSGPVKPLNFLGYKVGMAQAFGKDSHEKSATFGLEVVMPISIIEAPPLKVFGVRAYSKSGYGEDALMDVISDKVDKFLRKKLNHFKLKGKKSQKDGKTEEKPNSFEDLEKSKDKITRLHLLVHTQPSLTGIGKKKPSVSELELCGNLEEQFKYAKEKLGNEVLVSDVFSEKQFVDVKAVTKGKGFQGVVKRFGIKTQRPKAKVSRKVGSIGPWHPATVMFTVARAGQMGYHTRTEYNKKILQIGMKPEDINPKSGFPNYGVIKNQYLILQGSIPGADKRIIGLRQNSRPAPKKGAIVNKVESISIKQ